jgi:hypothetical protein
MSRRLACVQQLLPSDFGTVGYAGFAARGMWYAAAGGGLEYEVG